MTSFLVIVQVAMHKVVSRSLKAVSHEPLTIHGQRPRLIAIRRNPIGDLANPCPLSGNERLKGRQEIRVRRNEHPDVVGIDRSNSPAFGGTSGH